MCRGGAGILQTIDTEHGLPHDLKGLIGAVPRRLYENFFAAASATLTEFAGSLRHLGGMPAFSLVLHTWKQDLGRHVHVDALVAGSALSDTGEWINPKKGFLFPVRALSTAFRGKFIAGLEELRRQGHLPDFLDVTAVNQRPIVSSCQRPNLSSCSG